MEQGLKLLEALRFKPSGLLKYWFSLSEYEVSLYAIDKIHQIGH
jgi:hypothetical protein